MPKTLRLINMCRVGVSPIRLLSTESQNTDVIKKFIHKLMNQRDLYIIYCMCIL